MHRRTTAAGRNIGATRPRRELDFGDLIQAVEPAVPPDRIALAHGKPPGYKQPKRIHATGESLRARNGKADYRAAKRIGEV